MSRAVGTMVARKPNQVLRPGPAVARRSLAGPRPADGGSDGPAVSRFGFDFSAIPAHSRAPGEGSTALSSAPPALPAAPKPKAGETKLGELEIEGVKEPIFRSFVPSGLWWFNGATPTLADLYPQEAVLPLATIGSGEFSLKITKGADKIKFDQGGATLTGKGLTEAKITTLAPSKKEKDVHLEIQHRAAKQKEFTQAGSADLTVRAPDHLDLLGTEDRPEGAHGFTSVISLRVFDNLGKPMPYIDVNEDFTTGTLAPGTDKAWGDSLATRHKGQTVTHGNAVFQDHYSVSVSGDPKGMHPVPSNPQTPRSTTLTVTIEHDWFVGSASTGKGVHVSHHVGRYYTDHAVYDAFTSPVAGGGKPGAATPQKAPSAAQPAPAAPAGHPGPRRP